MQKESDRIGEWCLIESNPCIFYDMLKRMGAKDLSVEDVYDLTYFDDYINNKDVITVQNILSIEKYRSQKEKDDITTITTEEKELYSSDISLEEKYTKLLKNHNYVYGIIFLFNIGKSYNRKKYIEHDIPENMFFAKQVIPNACATQAILSIVLNKDIPLNEEIENLKSFTLNFDSSMKGLTLSNCHFLRNIHNSYKAPIYIDKEDLYDEKKKSSDSFHFVSYIQHGERVYLLDGLQDGPVLINPSAEVAETVAPTEAAAEVEVTSIATKEQDWMEIARLHIKKEIEQMISSQDETENRFNILAIVKDKQSIIEDYMKIHRIIRQRVNIKLISEGENIELTDEVNEDEYTSLNLPSIDDLPEDTYKLYDILHKSSEEINYLEKLYAEQMEIKNLWQKERTFKFYNFYPFIMSSLNLMAKHNILKDVYQKEKAKKSSM
ncbi:deubiquinating/deneddylating enzyme, putative [Plasmodium ovale]|uniref:ubiquitinyl hydrolase 1 n=2 Tax=Plasmodium ovale TaxID=36330 RepID=A0A1A8VSM4_PLAOA|nr:deubiquinating/deneddylating enzyme, putative (UCH54) [Plasmodium ovale curtisi]SBS90873.1 deubiquinating/deneddylating enzyme, putative (UCH54) [Plasmodium ovale curtisi]SCP04498.1 deubiquinating/deneddylating enzyme, putative [Plasmodium ovale]